MTSPGIDNDIGKLNTVRTIRDNTVSTVRASEISLAGICRFTILTFLENLNVQIPAQSPGHLDTPGPNPGSDPCFDPSNIATVIATYLDINESSDVVQIPEDLLFPLSITDEGQYIYIYVYIYIHICIYVYIYIYIYIHIYICISGLNKRPNIMQSLVCSLCIYVHICIFLGVSIDILLGVSFSYLHMYTCRGVATTVTIAHKIIE
jgi:hypothetical protein